VSPRSRAVEGADAVEDVQAVDEKEKAAQKTDSLFKEASLSPSPLSHRRPASPSTAKPAPSRAPPPPPRPPPVGWLGTEAGDGGGGGGGSQQGGGGEGERARGEAVVAPVAVIEEEARLGPLPPTRAEASGAASAPATVEERASGRSSEGKNQAETDDLAAQEEGERSRGLASDAFGPAMFKEQTGATGEQVADTVPAALCVEDTAAEEGVQGEVSEVVAQEEERQTLVPMSVPGAAKT